MPEFDRKISKWLYKYSDFTIYLIKEEYRMREDLAIDVPIFDEDVPPIIDELIDEEIDETIFLKEMRSDVMYGAEYDYVNKYLLDLQKIKMLSREEERVLAERYYRDRDIETRNRLVEANLRWVVNIAKRYVGRGLPFLELIEEGNIGLICAVEKFEPAQGNRISTYATWWIRQRITRAFWEKVRVVQLPVNMHELIERRKRLIARLSAEKGEYPTIDDLASILCKEELDKIEAQKGMRPSMKRAAEIKNRHRKRLMLAERLQVSETSIDQQIDGVDDGETLGAFLPDDRPSPEEQLCRSEIGSNVIGPALAILTDIQKEVILRRFLHEGETAETLKAIAATKGVTGEYIRQIECNALVRMRGYFQTEHLQGSAA